MAQRKETKTTIKVRDLKPKKDAKGGVAFFGPTHKPTAPAISQLAHKQGADLRSINLRNRADGSIPSCGFTSVVRLFD